MTRLALHRLAATLLFALLAAGLTLAVARVAFADDGRELAVVGYHEAGPGVSGPELAGMWAVATRLPRAHPMRSQCPRLWAGRTSRASEALQVRRGVPRFAALIALADAVVRGEVVHTCPIAPTAWGGRIDRRRARRLGYFRLECGPNIANDFYLWRRPR